MIAQHGRCLRYHGDMSLGFAMLVTAAALAACNIGGAPASTDAATDIVDATGVGYDGPPPMPSGCVTDVTAGNHDYTCNGIAFNAQIPAVCQAPGCGLILQIHGDTGNGALMDANTNLRALGDAKGYIVLSPTGPLYGQGLPGSTWTTSQDAALVAATQKFSSVFRVNNKRIHATGFSRGGFVAWRMLCDHADLFASVAPGAAGNENGEVTCFNNGRAPSRKADVLMLMGRTDSPVPFASMVSIRDAAIANYGAATPAVVDSDANYTHNRWTNAAGVAIETFEHSYETEVTGPWGDARGHCFPGSTMDPFAPQYAVPCKGPNAFVWGQQVLAFFQAHPKQ
jgi:poly(3-hydroxybutyrate) depolymerase